MELEEKQRARDGWMRGACREVVEGEEEEEVERLDRGDSH